MSALSKRKSAPKNFAASSAASDEFGPLLDAAPDAVVIAQADGRIQVVNQQTENLFGYGREELLGQTVEKLVPERHRSAHVGHRAGYVASPRVRPMGSGMELHGRRKDGSEFPVEISLSTAARDKEFLVIATIRDISERKRMEDELRRAKQELEERVRERTRALVESNRALVAEIEGRKRAQQEVERLAMIVESSEDAIFSKTLEGSITSWNRGAEKIYGYRKEEVLGRHVSLLAPPERAAEIEEILRKLRRGESLQHVETVRRRKDGRLIHVSLSIFPIREGGRIPMAAATIARDITERVQLENQLRQKHKMEAIGRVAGGIAHDFNNLLGMVLGQSQALLAKGQLEESVRERVAEIRDAAESAATLTRQLLAFSRQQTLAPRALDLNRTLASFEGMLKRLAGPKIELTFAPAENLGPVRADASQLLQVVLNLVVNAREAMPEGGRIAMETANVMLDAAYVSAHAGARTGPHVMLAVRDTGAGMDAGILEHIFEPFFTTKKDGNSGMGLATVYGIVQQSQGSIWVYSEPGKGSSFKIYWPQGKEAARDAEPTGSETEFPRGTETVLLVEDAQLLRRVTKEFLEEIGYTVIAVASAEEAIEAASKREDGMDLLFTDVVMPGMNGRDLAGRMLGRWANLRVLFTSGYPGRAGEELRVPGVPSGFIEKPYTWRDLAQKIRSLLDVEG